MSQTVRVQERPLEYDATAAADRISDEVNTWNLGSVATGFVLDPLNDLMIRRPDMAAEAEEVVLQGRLHGSELPPLTGYLGGPFTRAQTRVRILKIFERDPELAGLLAGRQIASFHGARSGALPTIFEHGLMSAREVRAHGDIPIVSGERMFSSRKGQPAVSFANWSEWD